MKNPFLHGYLEEETYMELPLGYDEQVATGTVCKLKKVLDKLKQSPKTWFERFTRVMTSLGYKQSQGGSHSIYHSISGVPILLVSLDDIILTGRQVGTTRVTPMSCQRI